MDIIVMIFLGVGLIFFIGGTVGILRLPDYYTRLHAAGMLDAMGLLLALIGIALYMLHDFAIADILTSLKVILIIIFVFLTSPTATHAIIDAGVRAGLKPWQKKDEK